MNKLIIIMLLTIPMVSNAVSISPRKVIVEGKAGTMASLQFEVYGHGEETVIEFVKVTDLKADKDKILSTFTLAKEQRYVMPIDVMLKEDTEYYLCAVLKNSKSMRLRTCTKVTVNVQ